MKYLQTAWDLMCFKWDLVGTYRIPWNNSLNDPITRGFFTKGFIKHPAGSINSSTVSLGTFHETCRRHVWAPMDTHETFHRIPNPKYYPNPDYPWLSNGSHGIPWDPMKYFVRAPGIPCVPMKYLMGFDGIT